MSTILSLAAERQRHHRQRQRAGRFVLAVEVDPAVLEAMLTVGWVDESGSRDRAVLAEAISEALTNWAEKIRYASRL